MLGIARDNNLSETAFYVSEPEGLRIRWFTPGGEVTLCGHATLATAKVWFEQHPEASLVEFQSLSGILKVSKNEDKSLTLDFPSREGTPCNAPKGLIEALGVEALEIYRSVDDVLVVVDQESTVKNASPDMAQLKTIDARGVIISAKGNEVDFVCRFFAPRFGIDGDPVTGSAHCVLTPYWSKKLGKAQLSAHQLSPRGGELLCELTPTNRILITGHCQPYLKGKITIKL